MAGIPVIKVSNTKGLRIDSLPPEAWQIVTGQHAGVDPHQFYEKVPWLHRGVNLRADALSAIPYVLKRKGGEEPIDHPEDAIPWWHDMPELLDGVEADRTLYGAAYLLKLFNKFGIDKGLRRLDPRSIRPKYDDEKGLVAFERSVGGKPITLKPGEDVAYTWVASRREELGPGVAAARASLAAAGLLRNIDLYAIGYFERGAIGGLLIDIEEGTPSDADMTRLQEFIKRRVQGIRNAFAANVGRRKLNVHEIGQGTGDLALPELTNSKREDIATALGIPQSLLFSNAANFAVAEADTLNFHDKTILPEARKIQAMLNRQVFEPLGLRFEFQPKKLEIYQDRELRKGEMVTRVYRSGVITQNEAREVLDYPAIEGGDTPPPDVGQVNEAFADQNREDTDLELKHDPLAEVRADLQLWQRKASRRLKAGKPGKAREFESEHIPPTLHAAITGALEVVTTPAQARRVFGSVLSFEGYP